MQKESAKGREEHEKKPLKEDNAELEQKEIEQSTTDSDCGVFHKEEHKKFFAYTANVACGSHNYILGFEATAGKLHDSTVFPFLYDELKGKYEGIKNVIVDAGYKIPAIAKMIINDGKTPIMPYKRPMTKKGFFRKHEYAYDEYFDCYICPNNEVLKYSTTNRDDYKKYKSNPVKSEPAYFRQVFCRNKIKVVICPWCHG